jgi:DNA-binding PadR family transcriptional regulator
MTATSLRDQDYWNKLIAKSATRFFLLACLARKSMHGYELSRAIADDCNQCCTPTDAMIYPTIKELSEAGLIVCHEEVESGRRRKVCSLTGPGREAYRAAAAAWARVLPALDEAVAGAGSSPTSPSSKLTENP